MRVEVRLLNASGPSVQANDSTCSFTFHGGATRGGALLKRGNESSVKDTYPEEHASLRTHTQSSPASLPHDVVIRLGGEMRPALPRPGASAIIRGSMSATAIA